MGHYESECIRADFTLANVGVPVDARSKLFLRIVEMEGQEMVESNVLVEFLERLEESLFGPDVVARDEDMARVDADSKRNFVFRFFENRSDVLETVPDARALPRCCFEKQFCLPPMNDIFHRKEAFGNGVEALFQCAGRRGPGMEIEIRDVQQMASFDFGPERFAALLEHLRIGRAKVDQIAIVAHHLVDPRFIERFSPEGDLFFADNAPLPLLLVARKELDGGCADLSSFIKGVV